MRFGTGVYGSGRADLVEAVRSSEAFGYDTFVLPDHLYEQLAPLPALVAAAEASTTMRVGTWVLCNDFHHPVIAARELATVDVLSGGRLDIGLGAGYIRGEYASAGIEFAAGGERFRRLQDAVVVMKAMFAGGVVSVDTAHYRVRDQFGFPVPLQRPHPPLLLGGGGPKMLAWAAREADIVSVIPAAAAGGGLRVTDLTLGSFRAKIDLVRASAGARIDAITLNTGLFDMVITNDRRKSAREWLDSIATNLPVFVLDGEVTVDEILESPYVAFGTPAEIAEHLHQVGVETGVGYYTIFPHLREQFAPALEHYRSR